MFLHKLKVATPLAVVAVALLTYAATFARPLHDPPPTLPPPLALAASDDPAPAKAEAKPRPQAPRDSRLLLYRKGGLVLVGPDGKNEQALTEKGKEYHPGGGLLSPDGTRYAVLVPGPLPPDDGTPGAKRMPMSLHVRGLGEKEPGTDLGIDCGMFVWSPDGTQIACNEFDDGPGKAFEVRHRVVDLKTKQKTPLKLPTDHVITDWSRDGKFFLTTRVNNDPKQRSARLYLMNRDGSEHKALAGEKDYAMVGRLSPDGGRVLCVRIEVKEETPAEKKARQEVGGRAPEPTRTLQVLDVATGKFVPVADVPLDAEVQGYCWSPDGKKIAYTWRQRHEGNLEVLADAEVESHLIVCDPEGTNQKTILSEKGLGNAPVTLGGVDWKFVVAEKTDAEKLAGAWKLVSITDGGKDKDTDNGVMKFEKDKIKFSPREPNREVEASYKLDPAKNPKWFDLTLDGKTMLGIYELDGDNLKLCFNEDPEGKRPDKFVSERGTPNDLLIVLKREKP